MQHRYVGDVGDFGKYGLLRALMATHYRLGIIWYLATPENNGDGRHLSYLEKPREYRHCDPLLFDGLLDLVRSGKRSISAVMEAGLLPIQTVSYDRLTCLEPDPGSRTARELYRTNWVTDAMTQVRGCDLLFLDPDNGIGGRSFRIHGSKGHKHASWDEIRQFAEEGTRTLVVYHHAGRTAPADQQARQLVEGFKSAVPSSGRVMAVGFRRGSLRIFLVAPSRELEQQATQAVNYFVDRWGDHCNLLYVG